MCPKTPLRSSFRTHGNFIGTTLTLQKDTPIGSLFSAFQMDRLVKNVSKKTLELYETAWKFFGPSLEAIQPQSKQRLGEREERALLTGCKLAIAKAKMLSREISPVSINIYVRVMNTFFNHLYEERILQNKIKLPLVEQPTGDRREIFTDAEIETFKAFKPKTFNQKRAHSIGLLCWTLVSASQRP